MLKVEPHSQQNLKYLSSVPLQEKLVYTWYKIIRVFRRGREITSCWLIRGDLTVEGGVLTSV